MSKSLNVGDMVEVRREKFDIFHDFCGRIIGFRNGVVQVRDQDDNVFECFKNQLRVLEY